MRKNPIMTGILYRSTNLLVQLLVKGTNGTVVIRGSGHSVSANSKGVVTYCDPLFIPPTTSTTYGNATVLAVYFPKSCEGLEAAGKELAEYINSELGGYTRVILHGHSKCGCCFLHLSQWLNRKVTILAVSSPLNGTPVADLKAFSARLNAFARACYLRIFSDHNVDRDICPNSAFIKNLAINHAIQHHDCCIFVSKCDWTWNPVDWLLWLVDMAFDINGDGIVPYESQIPKEKSHHHHVMYIPGSHATSLDRSIKAGDFADWFK